MPAGLQIFNSFGTTQIDENWQNYGFRQRIPGTFTLLPPGPGQIAAPVNYTLSITGLACLVAVRSALLQVVHIGSRLSGTSWEFDFRIFPPTPTAPGADYSETIFFYVFDVPDGGAVSNVGLEVFNAAGARVYHTDMDVMKVHGVQQCNADFVGTTGRIYAPLVLENPIRAVFTGSSYFQSTRSLRVSANTVYSTNVDIGSGAFLEFTNEGLYAAVDVTGLA